MDISKRCSRSNPKDNINRIEKLYSQNEAVEVMQILNKSLSELYGEYMNNKIPEYSFENDLNLIEDKNDAKYSLYGIGNHSGSINFGHYYAYIKLNDKYWYEFNDSMVRRISGGINTRSNTAYTLFYKKRT